MGCISYPITCPAEGDQEANLLGKILQILNDSASGTSSGGTLFGPKNFVDSADGVDGVVKGNDGTTTSAIFLGATGHLEFVTGTRVFKSTNDNQLAFIGGPSKSEAAFIEVSGGAHPTAPGSAGIMTKGDAPFSLFDTPNNALSPVTRRLVVDSNGAVFGEPVLFSDTINPASPAWTMREIPGTDQSWQSITYGGGQFVALAPFGTMGTNKVMTSPDGITWTLHPSADDASTSVWWDLTYGNGTYVAIQYTRVGNRAMSSPDGINWTLRATPDDTLSWFTITFGAGLFVGLAFDGTANNVMLSSDGINWSAPAVAAFPEGYAAVTYGGGMFAALGFTGGIQTSPNGSVWTTQITPASANTWSAIAYGNGIFVAVSYNFPPINKIMTSPDGINWTLANALPGEWFDIIFTGEKFIAVSFAGLGEDVMESTDGITWTLQKTPGTVADYGWYSIASNGDLAVAVSPYSPSGSQNIGVMTFSGTLSTGFYRPDESALAVAVDGVYTWRFEEDSLISVRPGGTISFGYGSYLSDVNISRDTTGILAIHDGIENSTGLRIYETRDATLTNFSRLNSELVSSVWTIRSERLGTGTLRPVTFGVGPEAGTDIAGKNLILHGGQPTGAGAGGSVSIQVAPAGAAGTTVRTLVNRIVADNTGLGFFAHATAAQQVSAANLTNNVTAGGTDNTVDNWTSLTVYTTDAAAIRNAVYQLARKLKQVNDGLRAYGILT